MNPRGNEPGSSVPVIGVAAVVGRDIAARFTI